MSLLFYSSHFRLFFFISSLFSEIKFLFLSLSFLVHSSKNCKSGYSTCHFTFSFIRFSSTFKFSEIKQKYFKHLKLLLSHCTFSERILHLSIFGNFFRNFFVRGNFRIEFAYFRWKFHYLQ